VASAFLTPSSKNSGFRPWPPAVSSNYAFKRTAGRDLGVF
jgi:hypothetical protein